MHNVIFYMKKITIYLSSIIFIILIGCSVQSVVADHTELGDGIYKNYGDVNLTTTQDSEWLVNLQLIIRTGDGQLINVTESSGTAAYIPHEITDHVFNTLMGEKEIITIDNIKYEKVQYTFSPTLEQRWLGMYPIFEEVPIKIKVEGLAENKVFNVTKDHALWKIHYCADFSGIGHDGLQCIPIFQVLVPTITLEPGDVITHHWTILRELN